MLLRVMALYGECLTGTGKLLAHGHRHDGRLLGAHRLVRGSALRHNLAVVVFMQR